MSAAATTRRLVQQFLICLTFYTRIPAGRLIDSEQDFASSQWAAPLVGVVIGMVAGSVFLAAELAAVPASVSAGLCLTALIVLTGALHEDGLADAADGFGGGSSKGEKLEIMRDSRLGSFGALALIVSCLIRWACLTALASGGTVFVGLIAAHCASRAMIPLFMLQVSPARSDGLSAGVVSPDKGTVIVTLLFGIVSLLILGPLAAAVCTALLAGWLVAMKFLCERQIGGQTGDVIGALQQGAEILVLVTVTAFFV
ncbi:MAG: adenosylcobinamide-GDP ribazoletransferase [Rhizobiaceae bacterium]